MKKIIIKDKCVGYGIKHIGWSGRGWPDGGPSGAGPINCQAPSWESYGQEIGINMVRMGFSIRHFLPAGSEIQTSFSEHVKKGLSNTEVSWAKSEQTSYSYAIQRCRDLGWKILICLNPSYRSAWPPSQINSPSPFLRIWKQFCFDLTQSINEFWPGMAEHFEITNEPDIGYFDGETFLPDYQGSSGGITSSSYSLLLQNAYDGIKKAAPQAKIIGPGLASWSRNWIAELLIQSASCLDGLSYHNVAGNLKDADRVKEARELLSEYAPRATNFIYNSEWAWWPYHDTNRLDTALRIAQILYGQAAANTYGSLYLGPAQPEDFKKGLGVLKFSPDDPNSVEKTKSFFCFRLMVRGVLGGKQLELMNPFKKLNILAFIHDQNKLVVTILNPSKKKFKNLSLDIDENIRIERESFCKSYRLDKDLSDSCEEIDYTMLKRINIRPESLIQFVIPLSG